MNNTDNGNLVDCNRKLSEEELGSLWDFATANHDLDKQIGKPLFLLTQEYGLDSANSIYGLKCKYGCDWNKAQELFLQGGIVDDPPPCDPTGSRATQSQQYLDRYIGPEGLLERDGWDIRTLKQMRHQTSALVDRIEVVAKQLGDGDLCTALVVGHVQSGKTANFCADINKWMDIASSMGQMGTKYSTFIILTSNNTALGTQTEERLRKDVIRVSDFLENFKHSNPIVTKNVRKYGGLLPFRDDAELRRKNLDESGATIGFVKNRGDQAVIPMEDPKCVVAVAIKNPFTINKLCNALDADDDIKTGGVVIIDDEADVITPTRMKNGEAAKTRQALLDMIDTIRKKKRPIAYVAFTATPYASVLNQFPSKEGNPLYPHIVQVLKPSDEYFGSARILGGLREMASGQVQIITEDIKSVFKKGKSPDSLPDSLKEAFSWFLCTVCARRCRKAEKPVSMLIHIARDVGTHSRICELLQDFVQQGEEKLIDRCKTMWEGRLKKAYTKTDIPFDYPGREKIDEYDIPWEDIEVKLRELIHEGITKENEPKHFTRGLNFRIVNSKYKKTTEDFHYPTNDEIDKEGAPKDVALVAIGGDRIARGLTLDGLTTSYFAREAKYGDSLLQFARWQGYRRGYELLPRVWITKALLACFKEAAWMEQETRLKLEDEFNDNVDHWAHPVTVAVCRNAKLKPTGKMRDAQAAMESTRLSVDTSYIGNDPSVWKAVFDRTDKFVSNLGNGSTENESGPVIWRNVPGSDVLNYLKFVKSQYTDSAGFASWQDTYEEEIAANAWNVCFIPLKGKPNQKSSICLIDGFFRGRPMRMVTPENMSPLYIKTVRANANADDIVDVPGSQEESSPIDNEKVKSKLAANGLDKTPLLRIYLHAAMNTNGEFYLPGKIERDAIATNPIILLSIAARRLQVADRDRIIYHVNPAEFSAGDPTRYKEQITRSIFELVMDDDDNGDDNDNGDDSDKNVGPCVRCKFIPKDTPKNNTPDKATILKGSCLTSGMVKWLREKNVEPSTMQMPNGEVLELQSDVRIDNCLAYDLAKGLLGKSETFNRKDCDKWVVVEDDDLDDDLAGQTLYSLIESGKEDA